MSESANTAPVPKTITIEYLGTRGNPLVIPATNKRTWSESDKGDEPEELAIELLEQGGFHRVPKAPAPDVKVGDPTGTKSGATTGNSK